LISTVGLKKNLLSFRSFSRRCIIFDIDNKKTLRLEFKRELRWFEEEFDSIFSYKTHNFTKQDVKIANQLLDKLSESINKYKDEKLLYDLVSTINNIEKKYPEFF